MSSNIKVVKVVEKLEKIDYSDLVICTYILFNTVRPRKVVI